MEHSYAAALPLLAALAASCSPASAAPVWRLYGADAATDQLLVIDPATGAASAIGSLGDENVVGMAYDPTTDTLFGSGGRLTKINRLTGEATPIGGPLGFAVSGLAAHPTTGQLFGVDSIADVLVTIDKATGVATEVGPLNGGDAFANVTGLAFDPSGATLYGVENGNDQLVTVDPVTGAVAGVGSPFTVGGLVVTAIAFDPRTGDLFGGDAAGQAISQLVDIDPVTGVGAPIGPTGFRLLEALAFAPPVPEPASGMMLVAAVVSAGGRRARDRTARVQR